MSKLAEKYDWVDDDVVIADAPAGNEKAATADTVAPAPADKPDSME